MIEINADLWVNPANVTSIFRDGGCTRIVFTNSGNRLVSMDIADVAAKLNGE